MYQQLAERELRAQCDRLESAAKKYLEFGDMESWAIASNALASIQRVLDGQRLSREYSTKFSTCNDQERSYPYQRGAERYG